MTLNDSQMSVLGSDWSSRSYNSCYLFFTSSKKIDQQSILNTDEMRISGFLPPGLFQRLSAKVISWSVQTSLPSSPQLLYKTLTIVYFGGHRLRLQSIPVLNCIALDVEGSNPTTVHQRVLELLGIAIQETMKNLLFSTRLIISDPSAADLAVGLPGQWIKRATMQHHVGVPSDCGQFFTLLSGVQQCITNGVALMDLTGRTLISSTDLKAAYSNWLNKYTLIDYYDLFISYRWNQYDSALTRGLFDRLSLFPVTSSQREIETFLDVMRLQNGRDFRGDFAKALIESAVILPIVSMAALDRLISHDVEKVDNLLVEWILAIICYSQANSSKRIFPFMLGRFDVNTGKRKRFDFSVFEQMPGKLSM
jgi:hypothetical protein